MSVRAGGRGRHGSRIGGLAGVCRHAGRGGDVEQGGEQVIGVMAKDSTNNYYCIESGERVEYQLGESVKLRDDDTARRLGWLMDHYRDGTAAEHAAIAVLAHDLLDLKPDTWKSRRVSVMRDNPTLRRKVEQMWEEAGSNAPANATVTRTYAEGTRTGRVTVSVTNAQGKTIAGIRYAATLNGPAVFANGSATVTGISGAEPIVYSWKATGEGEVKAWHMTASRWTCSQSREARIWCVTAALRR